MSDLTPVSLFSAACSGSHVQSGSHGVYRQSVEPSTRELPSVGALLARAHGGLPRGLHLEWHPARGPRAIQRITDRGEAPPCLGAGSVHPGVKRRRREEFRR